MTKTELDRLHAYRLAIPTKVYTLDNGDTYEGTIDGRVKRIIGGSSSSSTSSTSSSSSSSSTTTTTGGGEDLADTLVLGNITGGNNILISNGDFITTPGGQMQLDFGSDTYFAITTDAGGYGTPYITLTPTDLDLAWFNGGLSGTAASLFIQHTTQIQLATALLNISYLGGGGNRYLQTNNAGDISAVAIPTAYTDEMAQDAIGLIVTKYLSYDDATPQLNFSTRSRAAVNSHNHFNFK
jgi:hypothetical protein